MSPHYVVIVVGHDPETEVHSNVDSTKPQDVTALWAALPPDLRLALAKTAPKVAGKWENKGKPPWLEDSDFVLMRRAIASGKYATASCVEGVGMYCIGETMEPAGTTLASAQAACDDALLAQGYVLDGETP